MRGAATAMKLSNSCAITRVFGSLDQFCVAWRSELVEKNWDRGRHDIFEAPPPGYTMFYGL